MNAVGTAATKSATSWENSAGVETLRRMANVDQYNRWIYSQFSSYIKGSVLEVGCGIGNMTPFLAQADRLMCIDLLAESLEHVSGCFPNDASVEVLQADIASPQIVHQLGRSSYDAVVCINVLEHIEQDGLALQHMYELLGPEGVIVLFVPAGSYLYGSLDRALGHYRRYDLPEVHNLLKSHGFDEVESYYMNAAGVPGWFLSSRILRRTHPPRGLLSLFNLLTPVFAWVERCWRPPFGQSVMCIARRPAAR